MQLAEMKTVYPMQKEAQHIDTLQNKQGTSKVLYPLPPHLFSNLMITASSVGWRRCSGW